ncbi:MULTISPECIES: hypothetical protein [Rhodococcus]|uniref:hypothetical protein n=1 Tax=Rhodococcus TaxID=1827 RepID=UPI001F16BFC1|nr:MULTISPECIES: hypothetical protein [Rhodococcus]UOT08319.1 hypothetical protein MPY17_39105 [Rhodococcus opacus]
MPDQRQAKPLADLAGSTGENPHLLAAEPPSGGAHHCPDTPAELVAPAKDQPYLIVHPHRFEDLDIGKRLTDITVDGIANRLDSVGSPSQLADGVRVRRWAVFQLGDKFKGMDWQGVDADRRLRRGHQCRRVGRCYNGEVVGNAGADGVENCVPELDAVGGSDRHLPHPRA